MNGTSSATKIDARVCPNCGKPLGETATVCHSCGLDLLAVSGVLPHGASVVVVEHKKSSGVDTYLKGLGVLGLVMMSLLGLVALGCMVSAVLAFMPRNASEAAVTRGVLGDVVNQARTDINLGQTVVAPEVTEATLSKVYFAKKVIPPNPANFYRYYEAKDPGATYLDVTVSYKNLQAIPARADDFGEVRVVYADKYEYPSFSTIEEDGGGDFTYTNITDINPLQVGVVHYLVEVPEEVETSDASLQVVFEVDGNEYLYRIR